MCLACLQLNIWAINGEHFLYSVFIFIINEDQQWSGNWLMLLFCEILIISVRDNDNHRCRCLCTTVNERKCFDVHLCKVTSNIFPTFQKSYRTELKEGFHENLILLWRFKLNNIALHICFGLSSFYSSRRTFEENLSKK